MSLRLGIVADSPAKQQELAQLVNDCGYQLCRQWLLGAPEHEGAPGNPLDAWLLGLTGDAPDDPRVEQLLGQSQVPVIVSDTGNSPDDYQTCLRKTAARLARLSGDLGLQQHSPARDLWILAASTGGPAAVKRFLAQLPANLGMALLYVQHIDHQQTQPLLRMMNSSGAYPAHMASQGKVLAANQLTLVSAQHYAHILDNRTLNLVTDKSWQGDYAPSIDQISASAAQVYRQHCGLIIFTGMGDDGAASSRLIKHQGGQVWVQTPSDCTSDSMPKAALATGCVSYMGSPEALARALTQHYRQHCES